MKITFHAHTRYPDEDRDIDKEFMVDVPEAPPRTGDDWDNDALSEWAEEHLLSHTGDGSHEGAFGAYDVKVLACAERPELVGYTYELEG